MGMAGGVSRWAAGASSAWNVGAGMVVWSSIKFKGAAEGVVGLGGKKGKVVGQTQRKSCGRLRNHRSLA